MTKIKESNYWSILDFANGRNRPEMQGTKLQALFALIEKKGEPIKSNDKKLNGVKALKISDNEFIAIRRAPINGSFYPCVMHTYLLQLL